MRKSLPVLITLGVLLTAPALAEQSYLHNTDQGLIDLAAPVGTWWHELYPLYCAPWQLTSWIDNGDGVLSPSDCIDMTDAGGDVFWYHVDEVTVTVGMVNLGFPTLEVDTIYMDFLGGFAHYEEPIDDPVGTEWHEIHPTFCQGPYHVTAWHDNGDGLLSYCDTLVFAESMFPFHVLEVATDLILTGEGGPSAAEGSTWGRIKSMYR